MNTRLYAAAATLPKDALVADRNAFFGSIMATLNHIIAGDTIWLRRFMGHPSHFPSLEAMADIPAPSGLAHIYSDDLKPLSRFGSYPRPEYRPLITSNLALFTARFGQIRWSLQAP